MNNPHKKCVCYFLRALIRARFASHSINSVITPYVSPGWNIAALTFSCSVCSTSLISPKISSQPSLHQRLAPLVKETVPPTCVFKVISIAPSGRRDSNISILECSITIHTSISSSIFILFISYHIDLLRYKTVFSPRSRELSFISQGFQSPY